MKKQLLLIFLSNLVFIYFTYAQSVEIQGQLKLTKTEESIINDSVLVKLSDGRVGVKDAYKIDTGCNLNIGDSYEGGIIFHLDGSSCHGLIISSSDNGQKVFSSSLSVTRTNLDYLYSGFTNTKRIIAVQGAGDYAAKTCNDYSFSGFDNWYLPSLKELTIAFNNLVFDGKGSPSFTSDQYWSSTELDSGGAATVDLGTGDIDINVAKSEEHSVRCIRSF